MTLHEAINTHRPAQVTEAKAVARRRLDVSWPTVILFAAVISYASGFWVTSLQGAIGSLERSQPPFQRWLRDSTLMLPVYGVAVLIAVLLARRWFGQRHRTVVRVGAIAVSIIAACTFVGVAEVANSSAYDYHLQTQHIDLVHELNHSASATSTAPAEAATGTCVGACAQKQSTLGLHVRAVTRASVLLLITNIVLVAWLLAVGGDRLWKRRIERERAMTTTELQCSRTSRRSATPRAVLLRQVSLRADGTLVPVDGNDDRDQERLPSLDAGVSRPTTIPALAGIGAGAIHAAAFGAHADHRVLANIFVVLAVLQLGTGVALLVRPGRRVAKAVVAVNAFAVAGWLLTRTVGVWVIAGLGVERPGFGDTVCALLGAVAAVGAAMVLSSDTRSGVTSPWLPARSSREWLVGSIAVVLLAVPAMSSAALQVHEHGATGADHAHEAVVDARTTEPAAPVIGAQRPADQVSSNTSAGNGVDEDGAD